VIDSLLLGARWRGSNHDAVYLCQSPLFYCFNQGLYSDLVLLGDYDDPLLKWLMTGISKRRRF